MTSNKHLNMIACVFMASVLNKASILVLHVLYNLLSNDSFL